MQRRTIIHVGQPLKQICLLMKTLSKEYLSHGIHYMFDTRPKCLIGLSAREAIFLVLVSVLFLYVKRQ